MTEIQPTCACLAGPAGAVEPDEADMRLLLGRLREEQNRARRRRWQLAIVAAFVLVGVTAVTVTLLSVILLPGGPARSCAPSAAIGPSVAIAGRRL